MSVWLGIEYFGYRYDHADEYVKVIKDLWRKPDFLISKSNISLWMIVECNLSLLAILILLLLE